MDSRKVSSQQRAQAIHLLTKSEGWQYLDAALQEERQQNLEQYVKTRSESYRSKVVGIDMLYELITTLQNDAVLERAKA